MDAAILMALVKYHASANDQILTIAARLSEEELRRPAALDHGSAFQTIRHLVDVDWSWREACTGHDVGRTYVWDHGFVLDDLQSLHAFCREEDARLRNYVETLDWGALNAPPVVNKTQLAPGEEPPTDRGDPPWPRWLIIAHVVNHGTQHRSELARYLTDCGHSPGNLDMLDVFELP